MKLSLHLGLNRLDPAAYGGWPGFLNACENDASGLATALSARGFNTRLLLNENCTRANFRAEITQLAKIAQPGDLLLLTYSGHGGQQYSLTETDGFDETLCFFDGQLVDDEFVRLLAPFAPGVHVVVVLDCCHAGGQDRSAFRPAKRLAPAETWLHRRTARAPRRAPAASIALFCACQENETASDGDKFGAWTGSLLNALDLLSRTAAVPSRSAPPSTEAPALRASDYPSQPAATIQTWFTVAAAHCPQGQHPILRPLGETGVLNQSIA